MLLALIVLLVAAAPLLRSRRRATRVRAASPRGPVTRFGDAGQTTAEYALVIVGAAALALLLIGWATKTDAIGKLFDFVLQQVKGRLG